MTRGTEKTCFTTEYIRHEKALILNRYTDAHIMKDLGLHRISGFVCRISGRISGQKDLTWYILSSKPRSPLNITLKFRKL